MKLFITLIICFLSSIVCAQKADLKTISIDKETSQITLVVKDDASYRLLSAWTENQITQKYTQVEGLLAYKLDRKTEGNIEATLLSERTEYIAINYLNVSDESMKKLMKELEKIEKKK
jgi:hypothetical protein